MDVLEFVMEMDRSGRDIYRSLAAKASRPGAKRIFDRIAEEEERSVENYRRMKTGGQAASDSPVLKEGDHPFKGPVAMGADHDEHSALRLVLEMERKVCRFLEQAARREADPSAGGLLRQVAAVECGELEETERFYDFINAPNEFLAWGEFSNLDEFHNFGRYEDNRTCGHTA